MKYPYMIKRIKKRVLTWFFGVEYNYIYCFSIEKHYKRGDEIFKLSDNGSDYVTIYAIKDEFEVLLQNYKPSKQVYKVLDELGYNTNYDSWISKEVD